MARTGRIGAVAVAAIAGAVALGVGVGAARGLSVTAGTAEQRTVVAWAVESYHAAGMTLPAVEIRFHDRPAACGGNSGYYVAGRLDVCVPPISAYARNVVVHELAHAWCEGNLSPATIDRFLRLRGLATWNDARVALGLRGNEQAAEIIAWAVGDRTIEPLVPGDGVGDRPGAEELREGFRTLTGLPAPA
jgi:hypothetical protein